MIIKSQIKGLATKTLIVLSGMTVSSASIAQEKLSADLKEFKITIEKTSKGLIMQSDKGSAWIDLSFNLSNNKPQAIDEYGMTQSGKAATNKDP
ncbi:MAG: hypothetical protein MUE71_09855, partial [Chitinophagaceae bacterium]|nr:hypothetical protein [Chitinophagaceae bacterium]